MNVLKFISFDLITDKYRIKLSFLVVVNKKWPRKYL